MDEIFDKVTNISNKDTFFDQNQATIEKLFLRIVNRTTSKKMTKKAIA